MQINEKHFRLAFNKRLMVILGLITLSLLPQSFVYAQTGDSTISDDRTIRKEISSIIKQAVQLMSNENYQASLEPLNTLLQKTNLNTYEKTMILQMKAQVHYELGQTQDAIKTLNAATILATLSENQANQFQIRIAQLITRAEILEQWGRNGNELTPQHIEELVLAWVSADNYQRALPWAEKWFENANPKQRKHYDLLNFLYHHIGLTVRQSILHDEMKARWPEDFSDK